MQYHSLYTKEQNSMTFQVGLVGNDGLVLASDKLFQDCEGGAKSPRKARKFESGSHVTCCYSGDIMAMYAAQLIAALDWTSISRDTNSIKRSLLDCGKRAYQQREREIGMIPPYAIRKVIVAAHNSTLWLLHVSEQSAVEPCEDRVIAGDTQNTARQYVNRFAVNCESRPVLGLVRLAAFAVLMAGYENCEGVEGLDVVMIRGELPYTFTKEQIQALKDSSEKLCRDIEISLSMEVVYPTGE